MWSVVHTGFEFEYDLQLLQTQLINSPHGVVDYGAADEENKNEQIHIIFDGLLA